MIGAKKSMAAIVFASAMLSISWAQQTDFDSHFPPPPAATCRTFQLQSEDGKPVADVPVHLKVAHSKFARPHSSAVTITFKIFKKLKTDAQGKVQLPELKPETYYLALPEAKKFTSGAFAIPDDGKPGDCTQAFVLKDKGNMVHIEAVQEKAADKK
jgi:hypothetical protein